jgi:hypothetical protein
MDKWSEMFAYKDGDLYWLPRPAEQFKTIGAFKSWNTKYANKIAGHDCRLDGATTAYTIIRYNGFRYRAHRIIWEMHNGTIPDGMQIDHIDGNGLNNRLDNIRLVTCLDNMRNRAKSSRNTSGYLGISWVSKSKKWLVQIGKEHGGLFESIDEAILKRKELEALHGYHPNHGVRG